MVHRIKFEPQRTPNGYDQLLPIIDFVVVEDQETTHASCGVFHQTCDGLPPYL